MNKQKEISILTNACSVMDSYFQAPHDGNPSEWDKEVRKELGQLLKEKYEEEI